MCLEEKEDDRSSLSGETFIHRYLVLLVEIIKRYLLLKMNAANKNIADAVASMGLSESDRKDLALMVSNVERLRSVLQNIQCDCLPASQSVLLDTLECFGDCASS